MVIGKGVVAKNFDHFSTRNDVIIFASGVSNSKITTQSEFKREKKLLEDVIKMYSDMKIIYFSTFNLYDPIEKKSAYCLHKLDMEKFIKENVPFFNIFRIGHVASRNSNQYTVLSFLYNSINDGTYFKLWKNASRNIIDIDDISKICTYIIDNKLFNNEIINVCNSENVSILEMVLIIEQLLGKKGNYCIEDKGGSPKVNNEKITSIASNLNIFFNHSYVKNVIHKYYPLTD